jgi:uncharacterized protein (DUF983 family)
MINAPLFKQSIKCGCPKCGEPSIFPHKFTLDVKDKCAACDLKIANHDSGDGPAFFLLSALCFIVTPLALWVASAYDIPLWMHAIIWTIVCVGLCLVVLQPLKAYFIALNYKHRGGAHGI